MDFKFELNNSPGRFPINIQAKNWKGSSFEVFRVKRGGYRIHGKIDNAHSERGMYDLVNWKRLFGVLCDRNM